jgi:salicylate hydroxylase
VYDDFRKERGQWLVNSSRFQGDCYEWMAEGCGDDFEKIEKEINRRNAIVGEFDVEGSIREAKAALHGS